MPDDPAGAAQGGLRVAGAQRVRARYVCAAPQGRARGSVAGRSRNTPEQHAVSGVRLVKPQLPGGWRAIAVADEFDLNSAAAIWDVKPDQAAAAIDILVTR